MSKEEKVTPAQERPRYEVMAVSAKAAFVQVADEKVWDKEIVFALRPSGAMTFSRSATRKV